VSATSILNNLKRDGVVAISLFVMPVIYHHIQYPYRDLEKFKDRSHRFMIFGLIPTGVKCNTTLGFGGLWRSLCVSVGREIAFGLAAIPFLLVYILFKKRK